MGRKRGADAPSLRIANVDIGGGTIDLSITTFAVTGDEATAARIKPHMAFRDGFNIAGDDVIREIVEQHVLPCIGQATGLSDPPQPPRPAFRAGYRGRLAAQPGPAHPVRPPDRRPGRHPDA